MTSAITTRITTLICETGKLPPERVAPDSRFDELDFDSLVMVELIFKLRKEFLIPDAIDRQIDEIETVRELVELVERSQAA